MNPRWRWDGDLNAWMVFFSGELWITSGQVGNEDTLTQILERMQKLVNQ